MGRLVRRLRTEGPKASVTPVQFSLLAWLERNGPTTTAVLASAERITAQGVGQNLDILQDRGLIERGSHPEDLRMVLVTLTREGRSLVHESRASRESWLAKEISNLDKRQLRSLEIAVSSLEVLIES
jgi:DNA-binding MarR family transcriptional regulator